MVAKKVPRKRPTPAKSPKKAPKTRTEEEYQSLRKAVIKLAGCAVKTLGSGGKIGIGSGMVIDLKTREVARWEIEFFDALEMVGIKYDREAYFKQLKRRRGPS